MTETYPVHPGAKTEGTSQDAADAMAAAVPNLRQKILRLFQFRPALTTDEAAAILDVSVLAVRPRFSELRTLGKIMPTGQRKLNESGMTAIVWRRTSGTPQMELL